jgi:hypothetical protein
VEGQLQQNARVVLEVKNEKVQKRTRFVMSCTPDIYAEFSKGKRKEKRVKDL